MQSPSKDHADSLSGGQVAGIVTATLVSMFLLLLLLFCFLIRRRRRRGSPGYESSDDSDPLGTGWEDLGPGGTGGGATGGAWSRNGGSGVGSEVRDRWLDQTGSGSGGFAYNPTSSVGALTGAGAAAASRSSEMRNVNQANVLAGTDPNRKRRWDPTIQAWRETVPTSPTDEGPSTSTRIAGAAADGEGRRSDETGITGQTVDRSSALEGIYGAFLGSRSRSRGALSSRQRVDTEETNPFMQRYRDNDDNYRDEVLAYRGANSPGLRPAPRPMRPRMPPRAQTGPGANGSGRSGSGTGSGLTTSNRSIQSIGMGMPSTFSSDSSSVLVGAVAGTASAGGPPQRRVSRKRVPTPDELDSIYSQPPYEIRERTSSLPQNAPSDEGDPTDDSPSSVAAAMFPLPPPSPRNPLPEDGGQETLQEGAASGSRTDSDDVVVFRGYGAGAGLERRDAAIRGRGGPGRRVVSGTVQESLSGSGTGTTGQYHDVKVGHDLFTDLLVGRSRFTQSKSGRWPFS